MKVGDLLYYRPNHGIYPVEKTITLGIVIGTCLSHDGSTYFRTLWFDDHEITEEPPLDSHYHDPAVGVLSESR